MSSTVQAPPRHAATCLMVAYRSEWGDNRARDLLLDLGYPVEVRCPARGDPLPRSPIGYAAVVVGGGLDAVLGDDRPAYVDELVALARACLDNGTAFLGFCFGAQVLAAAGGGRVLVRADGRGAFGYRPVRATGLEGQAVLSGLHHAYHLHFHGFEAPPGSVPLAASDLFPSGAFRIGANAYGFQFHPEIRADQVEAVLEHLGPESLNRPGADPASQHLLDAQRHDGAVQAWLDGFIKSWAASWEPGPAL